MPRELERKAEHKDEDFLHEKKKYHSGSRKHRSRSPRHHHKSKYSRSRSKDRSTSRHRHRRKRKSRGRHKSRSVSSRRDHYSNSRKSRTISPEHKVIKNDKNLSKNEFKKESNSPELKNFSEYNTSLSNYENKDDYIENTDGTFDKEKIHKEMEEKLRLALAKEGKVYPPPKPEASHPVFANDGSFLEIFKKMQEQMQQNQKQAENDAKKLLPLCKRRGGKILKTGIVNKSKSNDGNGIDPKDFWSIYLQEVKKYKNSSCDEGKTRSLVK